MARRKSDAAPAAGPSKAKLAYARFQNSTRTYYAAVVFFGLILAGVGYIFIPFGGSPEPGIAVVAPTTPTTTPQPGPAGAINGCLPQEAVEVPPELVATSEFKTTWTATGQMSVPSSPTGGPGVAGPSPHCFTRTPEGSLYAIATFVAEMAETSSNTEKVDVITRRSLHDSNFDSYVQKLAGDSPVTGEPVFRISGYRWQEYTPQRAVVEIQVTLLTGGLATQTNSIMYGVIWAQNDWLLLVPDPTSPVSLPDAQFRTFHPWGGTA